MKPFFVRSEPKNKDIKLKNKFLESKIKIWSKTEQSHTMSQIDLTKAKLTETNGLYISKKPNFSFWVEFYPITNINRTMLKIVSF